LPRASREEEEIKKAFSDAKVTLKPGGKGVFDISLNGKLIFSKLQKVGALVERYPDPGELVRLIKKEGFYISPLRVERAFLQLLKEVSPCKLLETQCSYKDGIFRVKDSAFNLKRYKNVYLLGSGKAVLPMAESIQSILTNRVEETLIIGAYRSSKKLKNTTYIQSSHPIPSQKSVKAAKLIKKKLDSMQDDDFFIYLLSGGTSSLLEIPKAGVSLEEIQAKTKELLKTPISIHNINKIRKNLSSIKDGKLAKNCKARGVALVLSDVLGDNLEDIGSAPLYPNEKIEHFIMGSNRTVLQAAKKILGKFYKTNIIDEPIKDEVKAEAKKLSDFASKHRNSNRCFLFGGEATVNMDKKGKGGRNQHLALTFLDTFNHDFNITLLCAATDGIDGNSDYAGAIVNINKGEKKSKDIQKYLKDFNSSLYHSSLFKPIKTDPTHNNLLDIVIMLIY